MRSVPAAGACASCRPRPVARRRSDRPGRRGAHVRVVAGGRRADPRRRAAAGGAVEPSLGCRAADGIGGSGGELPRPAPAASSSASFSSAMPIGPCRWALRNCRTTGSSLDSSISRGPNIARCLWKSRPMLSGTVPGGVDVVRDDQERRVDLRVEVDDQLVEVGRADRVEAGVRLVEQDDLAGRAPAPGPVRPACASRRRSRRAACPRRRPGRPCPSSRGRCP